jgi:hypothetical protein
MAVVGIGIRGMSANLSLTGRDSSLIRGLCAAGATLAWLVLFAVSAWAVGALYFDLPFPSARAPAAIGYVTLLVAALIVVKERWRKAGVWLVGFVLVLAWWVTLRPSNDRAWQPDVAQTAWAQLDGEHATIHNVRNFDYRTEDDYVPRWETRTFDLAQMRGVDLFVTYWGSPWIAHPIVSFQFGDTDHLAISIETRKVLGQTYSAIRGFFRQYELIYIIADERDVVRLRTNYRQGEDVYLYHIRMAPQRARAIFLDYVRSANALHQAPTFYNALTTNCTTDIRVHTVATASGAPPPWDWRILVNGKGDELLYERGTLAGALPFAELKRRAWINDAARAADHASDFSQRIREGRSQ